MAINYLVRTLQITMYRKLKINKFAHENVKKVGFSVIALTSQFALKQQKYKIYLNVYITWGI